MTLSEMVSLAREVAVNLGALNVEVCWGGVGMKSIRFFAAKHTWYVTCEPNLLGVHGWVEGYVLTSDSKFKLTLRRWFNEATMVDVVTDLVHLYEE